MEELNIDTKKLIEEINIEEIARKKLESLIVKKMDDFFSFYGDFGKTIEKKLKEKIDINLDKWQVPALGNFAISAVEESIRAYQDRQKEEIALKALSVVKNSIKDDELISCKDIEDSFAEAVWNEIAYNYDMCDRPEIETMEELLDFAEYEENLDIKVLYTDFVRRYSTFNIVRNELQLSATLKGVNILTILFELDKISDTGNQDNDAYKEGDKNIYRIGEILLKEGKEKTSRFNEKSIINNRLYGLNSFNLRFATAMLNGSKIDMNKISTCDFDEVYEDVY